MGSVYRRKVKVCTTCDRRLDTTAARHTCEASGHAIEVLEQGPWWIRYSVAGRLQCLSSESYKKADAKRLLKEREGDAAKGMAITADVGKIRFEEAAEDLLTDYRMNKKRSLRTITLRIRSTRHRSSAGVAWPPSPRSSCDSMLRDVRWLRRRTRRSTET